MAAVVVGAGISGLACARALRDAGVAVRVMDRGRVVGGRMASRRLRDTGTPFDGRVVDIGASYFTARDAGFQAVVDAACAAGVVQPWTDSFHVADSTGITGVRTGPIRYRAAGGLRAFPTWLAEGLDVASSTSVERIEVDGDRVLVDGSPVDAAAVCAPDPQALGIVPGECAPATELTWEPVIAVTAVFAERSWPQLDGVFVNADPVLTWIADDGSRRGDGAPVLVAHVQPVLAARHLHDPGEVLPAAIGALTRILGIAEAPVWVDAKRWTFARPIHARPEPFLLHDDAPLGMAGDGWHGGPRIETAWASGNALGAALIERLAPR